MQHFYKKTSILKIKPGVALNPLVSLISRLVARSGRKRGNRQTDRQNDKTTTVTLAAHALSVNNKGMTIKIILFYIQQIQMQK